ncbi:MAG: hypothetical protein HKP61_06345 [Dactylosporangium sp.]|nr:hypothetical protein [Dactylosporangium sp.]NNJ60566.1 hypothetical protein [Dactylosporangium sp.]
MPTENRNVYLERVVAQQQQLESDLRVKRKTGSLPEAASSAPALLRQRRGGGGGAAPAGAVNVRVTGFGRWKTVLVPPNAFVVHTRRGRAEPLHIGLGLSFRYRPATDSYLVVPGAMQTILISAFSICTELQGVVVQAYVQWIIQDFATAYRKLDFSDAEDPMRLVNLQLKEQAEAAIKDKVATMRVHEVLSDKQSIIEELTARLRAVAEGEGDGGEGLGLRIVTVQIKEAVVSSSRLWENLQQPYRAERERLARLAELDTQDAISERETAAARARASRQMADERELDELRHRNESAGFDRVAAERVRRAEREQQDDRTMADLQNDTRLHTLRLERDRQAEEHEIGRRRIEADYALRHLEHDAATAIARSQAQADHDRELLELERERVRGQIDNDQSPERVQARLVDSLAEIVSQMPKPAEVRTVTIGGTDTTTASGLLAELTAVLGALTGAVRR